MEVPVGFDWSSTMKTGEQDPWSTTIVTAGDEESTLRKGTWRSEEDAILSAYVTKYGDGDWKRVKEKSGLNRSPKSCRLRWVNHLRASLKKGAFTLEEEIKIIDLHAQLGNKWAKIASHFPGRTDNDIKNYVHALVRKTLRARAKAARRMSSGVFIMGNQYMDHSLPQLDNGGDETFDTMARQHSRSNATLTTGAGNLDDMLLNITSTVHGSGDLDLMMNEYLLSNLRNVLSNNLESFPTPSVALGQPQHISTLNEKVCNMDETAAGTYVKNSSDYVHGNQHRDISVNHGSGMMQNDESDANRCSVYRTAMPLVQSLRKNTPSSSQGGFDSYLLGTENSELETFLEMFPFCPGPPGKSNLTQTISGNPDAGNLPEANQQPCYVDPIQNLVYENGPRGTPPGVMSNTVSVSDYAISESEIPSWNWNSFP